MKFSATILCGLLLAFKVHGNDVAAKLQEAEDFLVVNPSTSLTLLRQIENVEKLPPELVIRWHLLILRAAVPTDKMDDLIVSLDAAFNYSQHPEFINNLTSFMSGAGIWLRKNDYPKDAQLSLECAYKYAKNNKQKLTLTNSMALVSRQLDDFDNAKLLYQKAKRLAKADDRHNVVAMIENNQGLIALEEGDFALAETHFRTALDGFQRIDKRSGNISAGINLLMAFLLQNKEQDFQRIYHPTHTLTQSFPNRKKQVFLFWLNEGFKVKTELNYQPDREALLKGYEELTDLKERLFLRRFLASLFALQLPEPEQKTKLRFERAWFDLIKRCDFSGG